LLERVKLPKTIKLGAILHANLATYNGLNINNFSNCVRNYKISYKSHIILLTAVSLHIVKTAGYLKPTWLISNKLLNPLYYPIP
jgi:hypothetical protein